MLFLLYFVISQSPCPFYFKAAILYNLKSRHIGGRPYTRTGDIIIAVNPYQWYDYLYAEEMRCRYAETLVFNMDETIATSDGYDARATLEPHVYETSSLAYRGLAVEGFDQSVLVSGESGAGKTETVKILLNDLASVQRGHQHLNAVANHQLLEDFQSPTVQRVLDSDSLLEAFGNAESIRNDNLSRFGRYMQSS